MANRPFHISASAVISPLDFDCTLTPFNSGTSDAAVSTTAVPTNHDTPPSASWANSPLPRATSTATADTNPTIASLPLILSGAGPLKASTSVKLELTFADAGFDGGGTAG